MPDDKPKTETTLKAAALDDSGLPVDWPKKVKDYKTATGKPVIVLTDVDSGERYFFRRPTVPEINRSMGQMARKKQVQAFTRLVQDCAIYPEPSEAQALMAKDPALAMPWGEKLLESVGGNREFDSQVF